MDSLLDDYDCNCCNGHIDDCYSTQYYLILQKVKLLKKKLSKSVRQKFGNSEFYKKNELYFYSITLTGHSDYTKILNSIANSKMFGIEKYCYGKEQNTNDIDNGLYHIHMLTKGTKFIDSKEIYVKNKKLRVDVKLLRNEVSLLKWHRYIHKETNFGDCPVDSQNNLVIL